jgi:hypothetical protein
MKFLKILCAIGFLVVLASNIWSISGWIEARGVYDDICYLRQAHLFDRLVFVASTPTLTSTTITISRTS